MNHPTANERARRIASTKVQPGPLSAEEVQANREREEARRQAKLAEQEPESPQQ